MEPESLYMPPFLLGERQMRKSILILSVLLMIVLPFTAFAAGSAPVTTKKYPVSHVYPNKWDREIIFTCTGDSVNGSIPNKTISAANLSTIRGWFLYEVEAYPTDGGTAPDAASVFILDSDGMDLLGSEDGGTTPYAGSNLIHATLKRSCFPNKYLPRAGKHVNYYPKITRPIILKVIDQGAASGNWTVVLKFFKGD